MLVRSFPNVFDALADTPEEAEDLKIRSRLLAELAARVRKASLPTHIAASRLGITSERLDDLLRGKMGLFTQAELVSLTATQAAAA